MLEVVGGKRPANPEHADAMDVAKTVLDLLERRRRFKRELLAPALDQDRQGLAGAGADDPLHVGEALDRAAVDGQHQVAGFEPCRLGGATGLDRVHAGGRTLLAVNHEQTGKNRYSQKEICQRTGDNDGRSLGHVLMHEAHLPLGFGHAGQGRLVRDAGGVVVAEEFHISAKGNG